MSDFWWGVIVGVVVTVVVELPLFYYFVIVPWAFAAEITSGVMKAFEKRLNH